MISRSSPESNRFSNVSIFITADYPLRKLNFSSVSGTAIADKPPTSSA